MRRSIYRWGDLFCGAGGNATGVINALDARGIRHEGWAVNHWPFAVRTMQINHPSVHTLEMNLEAVVPSEVIPYRHLDHLHASPSCTHHSRAKGGRPRSNQLRSQPDLLPRWIDDIDVTMLSVENVPEFVDWGPLDYYGRPIERLKGNCFKAWIGELEARNYIVEWRVVNCADYGDATSRRRFFLKAIKRGRGRIRWPEPTHAEDPQPDLWGHMPEKWRGIKECLDLADTGRSIFDRDRPLAENTLRRIATGAKRYWGIDLKPFIVRLRNNQDVASIDEPISSIACSGAHHALCTPVVIDHFNGGEVQDGTHPLGTLTTHDRYSVMQPIVLGRQGGAQCRPIEMPCPTIACAGGIRLITPIILDMSRPAGCDSGHIGSAEKPIRTITTFDNMQGVFPVLADGRVIDIRMRMLKPSELAAAHSFPADYVLTGNRTQQVKQIGNSVPVRTAAAMMAADLEAA